MTKKILKKKNTKPAGTKAALQCVNVVQAAEMLGLSKSYLDQLRCFKPEESPPYAKLGSRVVYRVSDLEDWIVEQLDKTNEKTSSSSHPAARSIWRNVKTKKKYRVSYVANADEPTEQNPVTVVCREIGSQRYRAFRLDGWYQDFTYP
jgi:predicted DNA-binding transcriptional regulator AlpA